LVKITKGDVSLLGKFIPKNTHFGGFGDVTSLKFGMRVRVWDSLICDKFYKKQLRGIPLWGKFIPKLPILAILAPVIPHF